MEMLLTGDLIDARTAERWGLVNRVVPAERLDEEVAAFARKITAHSSAVVRLGKRLFYDQVEKRLPEACAVAAEAMACNMMMEDAAEGIDAFLAKRPAQWRER